MKKAIWIKSKENLVSEAPLFVKCFNTNKPIKKAILKATSRGVFEAYLNDVKIGNEYLAPGWTVYEKRINVSEYDVADMISEKNSLKIQLTNGWYKGVISGLGQPWVAQNPVIFTRESGIIAELFIEYEDGTDEIIATNEDWDVYENGLRRCDIYNGAAFDATFEPVLIGKAVACENNDKSVLISKQGDPVVANERVFPVKIIKTPNGETVLDFGQNLAGTLEVSLTAKKGDKVLVSFAEILDKDGNFYNANYRTAKSEYNYTCKDGYQIWHPTMNFYGFRYIRIDEFPSDVTPDNFCAIVLHTKMRRTGNIFSSSPELNQLFSNIIWGQKSNFIDIPTDCPQRDERYGWTGDAQVFVRTASYNFDVQNFFRKWLTDMKLEQRENGEIPPVIPESHCGGSGAAWGDAVTICPWQMYLTYADKDILKTMFPAMKKWVDNITRRTRTEYLWVDDHPYGDWLELNAEYGQCKGKTRDDIVGSAFYAHSTSLICKTGKVLGEDVTEYEELYKNIVKTFKETYKDTFYTQTEHVLALHFSLAEDEEKVVDSLVKIIKEDGVKLQTGFVGTPYILHALSKYGHSEIAYNLLLRKEYPSWLYPISKGATTIWEHWDGIMPDGKLWPVSMNSYNHYAYGAVADWMYGVAAGINPVEDYPGFEKIHFEPIPTDQLDSFGAVIETKYGKVQSRWWHEGDEIRYEIQTPSYATAKIGGKEYKLAPGIYRF